MNYLLFANPTTGSPVLSKLVKKKPPKVVVTIFKKFDSWERIVYRFVTNRLTVEDKLRLFYKIEFYDYKSINSEMLKRIIKKNNIEIGFITTFSFIIPREFFLKDYIIFMHHYYRLMEVQIHYFGLYIIAMNTQEQHVIKLLQK